MTAVEPRASATRPRSAFQETLSEWAGGHRVEVTHRPHYRAALEWLARAQDATGCGGIARAYSLVWNDYFGLSGWEPAYPETTGYIIPTLYAAARLLDDPALAARAAAAAHWTRSIQLPGGGIQGGVIGQLPVEPAVFNTGQVLFGWLAALNETGDRRFADATERAADWLVSQLDGDGLWRRGASRFATQGPVLYNARTAWALAEAGARLESPRFTDAAARALLGVARRQRANGWLPHCCLTDPDRPLLHTIAYAVRGLVEGGALLGDARLLEAGARAAAALADTVDGAGRMPARFDGDWHAAAGYRCLTGQAQMANVWLRLAEITGATAWLEPVAPVLRFLKATQNRTSGDPGLAGGVKGSNPLTGEYGRCEVLSWATKFFVDALIRHERALAGAAAAPHDTSRLA